MKRVVIGLIITLCLSIFVSAQADQPMLYRSPTMSETHVVFAFAGDLWRVPRAGGNAVRLTSGTGNEGSPMFSPDGKWIAFSGQYDGNTDVFVIPANGGEPRRLTYHPGNDGVIGWSPDSRSILFLSGRGSDLFLPMMYTIPLSGAGLPEQLPFPMAGGRASYSPDGSKLAYMPLAPAFAQWKM